QTNLNQINARIMGLRAGIQAVNSLSAPTSDAVAQNLNFNLGPKAEWKDGQMAEMLAGMKDGDTAKFMQWTSDSNFIINSFVKKDGKFTQVVNGENKGDGLSVDEMVARADLMRLPSTLASAGTKIETSLSLDDPATRHDVRRFAGSNEWAGGWKGLGERLNFNGEGKGLDSALAKYQTSKTLGRVTPDAAADIAAKQEAVTNTTPDVALHIRPGSQNNFS
ncbi:MAG TPA: hypothetical protein PKW15_07105, partial [Alphaproteobacteria bacterium]|nr:hypothetical protein [Alphaproteobacteria bacterium]